MTTRLRPYQQVDVAFLLTAKNAICGTPMGGGKTPVSIAAARVLGKDSLPALVVCPASMRRTWKREIVKWWPGVPVYVVEGTAPQRNKILAQAKETPGIVVINWESVRLHSRLAPYGSLALSEKEKTPGLLNEIPFKLVIADECHKMRDPKSKQTRAVWSVAHNPTVQYRWGLTGTPLTKAPDTMWPILHFIDPIEWPSKTQFIERLCLKSFNLWGGLDVFGIRPDREEEFFSVFNPRFRRLAKEIILPDLPPIQFNTRYVKMAVKQQKAYNTMAEKMWAETEDGDMVIAANPISQLTRLTQFASATIVETEEGELRLSEPSSKLDTFMDDLDDLGTGLVVFAVSRQLLRLLATRFEKAKISYGVVEGGQSQDTRQVALDRFQDGKTDYLLVVVAAGGVGLTLTRASTAVFLQKPYSNVDYQQAIARIHRIGSEIHESINIIDYVTEDTVEVSIADVLKDKADMLEEIVRDRDSIRRMLEGKTDEENND